MKKISLVLTPEILIQPRKDIAGTERVFFNNLALLSKQKELQVSAFARIEGKKQNVENIYFPLRVLHFFNSLYRIPILRKHSSWNEVGMAIAQFFYVIQILLKSGKTELFITYSLPFLTVFSPD